MYRSCSTHSRRTALLSVLRSAFLMERYVRWAYLSRDDLNDPGQKVVIPLTMFQPGCEIPHLAVVAIVSKPHLGADEEDLLVVNDDPAVVYHVLVHDWPEIRDRESRSEDDVDEGDDGHADVAHDSYRLVPFENLGENLP